MMEKFFKIFPQEFDMLFYGVDIIVDSETGVHYFVDCNYLSNYANIEQGALLNGLDTVLLGQISEIEGKSPKIVRGEKSSNIVIRGRQLTPRNVENIGLAALGTLTVGLLCSLAYLTLRRKQTDQ